MTTTEAKTAELALDLGNGISIWKAHLDCLREQDKNARVMAPDKFDRLVQNIKADGRLESLPLCVRNPKREDEFLIISGHHRTRAARSAGVMHIYIMVLEGDVDQDWIRAKQLAHNALSGTDEEQVLAELYFSIQDVDARISSGLSEDDLDIKDSKVTVDEVMVDLDFEMLQIVFLSHQKQEFDDVIDLLEKDSEIHPADIAVFYRFKDALRKVGRESKIRNISAMLSRMCEIVKEFYASKSQATPEDK